MQPRQLIKGNNSREVKTPEQITADTTIRAYDPLPWGGAMQDRRLKNWWWRGTGLQMCSFRQGHATALENSVARISNVSMIWISSVRLSDYRTGLIRVRVLRVQRRRRWGKKAKRIVLEAQLA
jgi:hypothetical protein